MCQIHYGSQPRELPEAGAVVRRITPDPTRGGLWLGLGEAGAVAFRDLRPGVE